MKRFFSILLAFMLSITLFSCTTPNNSQSGNNDNSSPINSDTGSDKPNPGPTVPVGHEVIEDQTFSTGFKVMGPSAAENGRTVFKLIDYLGTVDAEQAKWMMARWNCPDGFNTEDSTEEYVDGKYVYTDSSKVVKVNPETGYLYLELNSSKVYEHTRQSGEGWPHILIEQNFSELYKIADATQIIAKISFTLNKVENKIPQGEYREDLHAAQFLWYFTLANDVAEDADPALVGKRGDYIWYGVPLYDSRHPEGMDASYNIDRGFSGSTNKMIYSMPTTAYLPPVEIGVKYQVEVDILPYMKQAFETAQRNDCMQNVKFENLVFYYMNLGFEIPGTYDMAATIEKLSVQFFTE